MGGLITRDNAGEVLGVKYDQLTVILINAVKEQQAQIDALRQLVRALKPNATACKEINE